MRDRYKEAEKYYKRQRQPTNRRQRKRLEREEALNRDGIFDPCFEPTDDRFRRLETSGLTVFSLASIPGCYVVKEGLQFDEQLKLYQSCWFDFPEPPATTNLTLHYGPLPHLAAAAQEGRSLSASPNKSWSTTDTGGLSAASLLKKLRWTSLGPHYNWTERRYEISRPYRPLPLCLVELWKRFTALLCELERQDVSHLTPDVALVNYYSVGDTLGGHQDDAEQDLSKPIVCLSLGLSGIFLMGGHSREVAPVPILLRSGDVVIMSGAARTCFHGVARVLNEPSTDFNSHLEHFFPEHPDMKLSILSRISVSIRCL